MLDMLEMNEISFYMKLKLGLWKMAISKNNFYVANDNLNKFSIMVILVIRTNKKYDQW